MSKKDHFKGHKRYSKGEIMSERIIRAYNENKEIFYNIVGTFFLKGGALLVSLGTTPAYMRYFSDYTVLGLWFTVLSVLNWVLSFDLGIGNGLRNKLTVTLVKGDFEKSKQYISSAYIILASFSIIISLFSLFVFPHINWNSIFNVSQNIVDPSLLVKCVEIVFIGLMFQFTLKLITSVLHALQKSVLTNFLSLISSVITLVYVLFAPSGGVEENLLNLAFINVLAINLPLLITTLIIFRTSLRESRPSFRNYDRLSAKSVLSVGMIFFCLQFMAMMIGNTNEFLISRFISPRDVVDYQVYNKLFNFFNSIFNLAYIPVWSAATKQLALKKYVWLKNTHKILLGSSLIALATLLVFVPMLPYVIRIWIGNTEGVTINWQYGVFFAILTGLMIWNGANCSIANGLGWLRAQLIFLTLGAIINIPIAYILTQITGGAWISIVIANIISLLPVCVAQPIYIQNKLNKKILNAI